MCNIAHGSLTSGQKGSGKKGGKSDQVSIMSKYFLGRAGKSFIVFELREDVQTLGVKLRFDGKHGQGVVLTTIAAARKKLPAQRDEVDELVAQCLPIHGMI
jgi:hypothetical protein